MFRLTYQQEIQIIGKTELKTNFSLAELALKDFSGASGYRGMPGRGDRGSH